MNEDGAVFLNADVAVTRPMYVKVMSLPNKREVRRSSGEAGVFWWECHRPREKDRAQKKNANAYNAS